MESFHWVTGTLTMVLALGMTRLLAMCVSLFRARGRAQMVRGRGQEACRLIRGTL